ncbi:carbohydrate kinase [Sungkyunkwania multivorans]|uniref:Carbohydrate kinase n=1 Tax=Sungkyunkwania multivorans TaxID=1173618 RepID=A0ABW3CWH9_9FLAO
MSTPEPLIICFGDILWDIFPEYKKVGGAPLNVALKLHSYGANTYLISAVGNDALGNDLLDHLHQRGLQTQLVQRTKKNPTGSVLVTIDDDGNAQYDIKKPAAWDSIQFSKTLEEVVKESDAFTFVSLAFRSKTSKETLDRLLKSASYKVFDVNLRAPHYNLDEVISYLQLADLIKLNDEELTVICRHRSFTSTDIEEQTHFIAQATRTTNVCVTLGAKGSLLLNGNQLYRHQGYKVTVKDTVGAGDSFLASLIYKLLTHTDAEEALDYASAVGALVASKEGANPIITENDIAKIRSGE